MKRSNTVKLIVTKERHRALTQLAIATAKCWNEVNWLRMQQFKEGKRIDFLGTGKVIYHKYKGILKVNASQVTRKNAEAWKSFFSLAHEKKEGRINWMKPRPPRYWKEYKPTVIIRNDRYTIDEENRIIHLKDFKLALRFKGKLKWYGKQGRLEIIYNDARRSWYAYIPVECSNRSSGNSNSNKASIDLGIVNLATVYVSNDGSWYLFKGGSVLSIYEYYTKMISRIQKILVRHKQMNSRRLRLIHEKRLRFLKHALNSMIRKIMSILKEKGVNEVIIGYPKGIAKNHGNKLTVNLWSYEYTIRRFMEIGEELRMRVIITDEAYTSKTCSLCWEAHNGRIKRGLFKCPNIGEAINADLNGAVNILHIPESSIKGSNPMGSIQAVNILHLHIPESLGTKGRGKTLVRDRGKWLKTQPAVYRWTSGAGWVQQTPASCEVMKMKAVNHKPVNHPKGTLAL